MAEKSLTLTRWWFLLPLLTLVLSVVGGFLYAIAQWVYILCTVLVVLLLFFQLALLIMALFHRQWWRALGIFVGSIISAVLLAICLVIGIVAIGMDKAHAPETTECVDSLDIEPTDTIDIIPNDSI